MQECISRKKLENNESVFGIISHPKISQVFIIENIKKAGFDYVFIDLEHTPYSLETIEPTINSCRSVGLDPWVRVPTIHQPYISRVLDLGATGLIIPRVENADQVRDVVKYMKFPPEGKRGFGGGQFLDYLPPSTIEKHCSWSNSNVSLFIQLEKKEVLPNVSEILSVKGVTGALVGPCDLSISLGVPGDYTHPKVETAIEQLLEEFVKSDLPLGIVDSMENSIKWHKRGMKIFCFATLADMVLEGGQSLLKLFKK